MTSHAHAIDLSQDQPPLPNQHFSSWLRGQTTLFISQIVAVLGIILFIAEEVYYVSHGFENGKLFEPITVRLIVDYAHILFITVFIVVLIRVLDYNERGSYRVKLVYKRVFKEPYKDKGEESVDEALETSKEQLKKFKLLFLGFWIGMMCLYVSFACQHTYEAHLEPGTESVKVVSLSLNGRNEGKKEEFIGEIHLSIADEKRGAVPEKHPTDTKQQAKETIHTKLVFASFAFFFNNLTLLFIFWCFLVMYITPDEVRPDEVKKKWRRYMVGSAVVVGSLIILFVSFLILKWDEFNAESAGAYVSIFDALSGVINAMVLALLIARLDSKLVGLRSWLISILYSYAAVQPLFLVFELRESELLKTITTLVLIFVFISKIYFFLIIFYALQTGKMLNYLTCFPILRKRASFRDFKTLDRRHRDIADGRAPFLQRLRAFGSLFIPKLRRRSRAHQKHTQTHGLFSRAHHRLRVSEWLDQTASRLLRSHYSLRVSEVIGWVAILYFFGSLIGSQVIPETQNWGGGPWSDLVYIVSKILRPPPQPAFVLRVIQLVCVALMIVTLHCITKDNSSESEIASNTAQSIFRETFEHEGSMKYPYSMEDCEDQLKKFKRYFLYFWYVTLLLYVILLFSPQKDEEQTLRPILKIWIFPVLSPEEQTFRHMLKILLFPALEFLFSSLNVICAFWCFAVLRLPAFAHSPSMILKDPETMRKHLEARHKHFEARQKLLINYSTFGILLLIAIYLLLLGLLGGPTLSGEILIDYATVFDGVTGLLSAIVLALLIARMDSKLFSLPSRLIWMLFAYASIQSLFIAFAQNAHVFQMVRTSVLTAALGLKICFFLIVAHSLQSGRMLNYLVSFPLLKERVDSIFENQFEIRLARAEEDEFTFLIFKKNRLHYSTTETFETREECDEAVENLRALMKESEPYGKPRHSEGTYWVEVKSGDKLLCESIPLRSTEEALDLIDESIGKVPYCKYNRL
jgi:hypothetical protein